MMANPMRTLELHYPVIQVLNEKKMPVKITTGYEGMLATFFQLLSHHTGSI